MMKTLVAVAGAAVVILTGCFGAYLVNRDKIQQHDIRLEYIEKSYNEQKQALEKVAVNLAAVEKILAELVGELKHLKKGSYHEKTDDARNRYALRNSADGLRD